MWLLLLSYLSFQFCGCSTENSGTSLEINEEVADRMIPKNYNSKVPPYIPGFPVQVNVSIVPWGIGDISIENMYFEVNAYIALRWIDLRLNITNPIEKEFYLPAKVSSLIWTPDVRFRNCLSCNDIIFDYRSQKLILKGKVLRFLVRANAKLFCDFDLLNYPMDKHVCFVEVISVDWKDTVVLRDGTPFLRFLRNASIPQFKVSNLKTGTCSVPDESTEYMTCIEYQMTFTRQIAYHLMLTYAPSFLIVLLTWISFWLEVEAAPPRVTLGLMSLLTLATQFSSAQKNLPPVSYAKAIDIWMFSCIFMVVGSLLEFAVAYSLQDATKKVYSSPYSGMNQGGKKPIALRRQQWLKLQKRRIESVRELGNKASLLRQQQSPKVKKNRIDSASKRVFPLAFLLFNICYWGYFCTR